MKPELYNTELHYIAPGHKAEYTGFATETAKAGLDPFG